MLDSETLGQNQSANFSPGWNDPPPVSATTGMQNGVGNGVGRLQLQRQRRPVDPSIQSGENFVELRGNTSSAASLQPTQHQQQQHFHQSRSFPQLAAATAVSASSQPLAAAAALSQPPASHGAFGLHSASAFTPISSSATSATPPMIAHSQSQTVLGAGAPGALAAAAATTPLPSRQQIVMPSPLTAATANAQMSITPTHHQFPPPPPPLVLPPANLPPHPDAPSEPSLPQPPPPPQQQQQPPTAQVQSGELNLSLTGQQLQLQHPPPTWTQQQQISSDMAQQKATSISNGQSPMLFSLPNIVPITTDQHNNRFPHYQQLQSGTMAVPHASGGGAGIDPDNYKVPVKAAGDVSLNGLQLAAFLTKATLLLQPGPTREGIQLRFHQFGEHVQAGQISEACLKKLNFVVDAIDRHVYDEAWQFFGQMIANFQNDCAIGGWAHGVRLLLQELLRKQQVSHAAPTTRSHSAGTRLTH